MKIFLSIFIFISFAGISCFSQTTNLSNGTVFDGEPYIAINPSNPDHLVVAWMGWVNLSNQFQIKVKTSFDAGQSWSATALLPHVVNTYSSADPAIAFNSIGEVFITYIDFTGTTPPVTGGVYICKSVDGGINWGAPKSVVDTTFDGTKWPIDRPWIAIDRSNSSTQGTIYVTSMNLNRTNAPYNPYVSISTDNGLTFSTSYLDTIGWLAGSLNPLPVASPVVTASGVFYATYPSFVLSQNISPQILLSYTNDAGVTFNHNQLAVVSDAINLSNYPDAKKAGILIADPSNADHLAYVSLRTLNGDLDVYFTETYDSGTTWTPDERINDDPVSNNRMQDLVWADFDNDGDLIITWRDRRNGTDGTFQNPSEIWAAFRPNGSNTFNPNFRLSNQLVPYDSILTSSGNDFMSVTLQNDIIYAVWGDTINSFLNIWFQKTDTQGNVLSIQEISSETATRVDIFPNPASTILEIHAENISEITIYDIAGRSVYNKNKNLSKNKVELNIEHLISGTYLIQITTGTTTLFKKVIITH